jgi:hypothetical protein
MRKILGLALVVSVAGLADCREETVGEKVERKLRNAADDVEDAAEDVKDELKD